MPNIENYKKMIYDTCDTLAEKVIETFLIFVSICCPVTDEQYEQMMFDSMEVHDCF